MPATRTRKQIPDPQPGELSAQIRDISRTYFISRSEVGEGAFIDDEAELVIQAVIETINCRHGDHVGQPTTIHLLHAERYSETPHSSSFFGSVTIRGAQRSALAYLPRAPFWELPHMIESGASRLELRFLPLRRGYGELLSINVGSAGRALSPVR